MSGVLLESRPYRPFKSSEEYLYAMKEDLAEWLQTLYPHLRIATENFMDKLETGVALCEHANAVKVQAAEYVQKKQARKMMTRSVTGSLACAQTLVQICDVKFFSTAKPGTFFARDNLSNFILWCRQSLQIIECLLFESDDLIMRKNEKHVILCLLEVARRGAKFGMLAPMLVQMERQIDREIAADQRKLDASMCISNGVEIQNVLEDDDDSDSEIDDEQPMLMYGPLPQIVTNDLKSLDEMVRDLVEKCTCPTQFPMIRVSEGKYKIGDTKVLIFVRILRNHVMVRVGGGWDTLSHYLDKHDPCRCRAQHRTTQGANLVKKTGATDLSGAQVYYDRSGLSTAQTGPSSITVTDSSKHLGPPMNALNRSRSRSPSQVYDSRRSVSPYMQRKSLVPPPNRSRSPTPNYTSTHTTKLLSNPKKPCNKSDGPQSLPYFPTQSPVYLKNKNPSNHVAHIQIPVDTSKTIMKSEAVLQVSGDSNTDHSDNASEVSDEGYRSLGVIGDKNKNRTSLYSQNSAEDAEDAERQITIDNEDTNDAGLRKTQYSSLIYGEKTEPTRRNSEGVRKPDPNFLHAEKHTRHNSIDRTSEKRSNSRRNSIDRSQMPVVSRGPRKLSTDRVDSPKTAAKIPISPKKVACKSLSANSNNNTWNGRQRAVRPQVMPDTFVRNSATRRSVSATNYDHNGRRVSQSAATSPTKPGLKQELMKVAANGDDSYILEQLNKLMKQYGSLNVLNDETEASKAIENEKSLKLRKDSKPENVVSRIPAPISITRV